MFESLDVETLKKIKSAHLLGVGGAGMSGLALLLEEMGLRISGCDATITCYAQKLKEKGIEVALGHDVKHLDLYSPDIVIYSSAIPEGNGEISQAIIKGIPVMKRAEILSLIFNCKRGIGIAGTHGKTTTTSMISMILEVAGLEPTMAIGGEVTDIGGNAKLGKGDYMVCELDESDRAFELFRPAMTVITNIDWDHVNMYPSLLEVIHVFKRFVNCRKDGAPLILCGEDKGTQLLMEHIDRSKGKIITYGFGGDWDWGAKELRPKFGGGISCTVMHNGVDVGMLDLAVSGEHNVLNALAACAVSHELGIPFEVCRSVLGCFRGAKRRLQHLESYSGIDFFDDYGHHPREIEATLRALKSIFPGRRIVVIFQPHRYTRTAAMYREFARALAEVDFLLLMPVYPADERQIDGVSSELIARELRDNLDFRNLLTCYGDVSEEDAIGTIGELLEAGDLLLTLGAGDVDLFGERVLEAVKAKARLGTPTAAGTKV